MIINVKCDENNIITSYAVIGKVEGGVDIETDYTNIDDMPPLSIGYYKVANGQIVIDEQLKEQIESMTD
jgi:hypothetical protein